LELARVSTKFPFVVTATPDLTTTTVNVSHSISIILALNKESMLMDPINWNKFKAEIQAWATNNILVWKSFRTQI
jgi:hypothetical protein